MTSIVVVGMERPEETGEGLQGWDEQGLVNNKQCVRESEGCKC